MSYGDYIEQLTYLLFLRWATSAPGCRTSGHEAARGCDGLGKV